MIDGISFIFKNIWDETQWRKFIKECGEGCRFFIFVFYSFPFLPCHFVAVDTSFANGLRVLNMHYSRADRPTSENPSQKISVLHLNIWQTLLSESTLSIQTKHFISSSTPLKLNLCQWSYKIKRICLLHKCNFFYEQRHFSTFQSNYIWYTFYLYSEKDIFALWSNAEIIVNIFTV